MAKPDKNVLSTIKAPVVMDAASHSGLAAFMRYLSGLKNNDSAALAAQEGARLKPYFNSMSRHLGGILQKVDDDTALGREKAGLGKISRPEDLKSLFNDMARHTRNTLLSEVVILPDNIRDSGPAKSLFDKPCFNTDYYYGGHRFGFGFLQVYRTDEMGIKNGSVTFPTFMIDHRMMEAVARHQPRLLLEKLQDVMTWGNHDMLHHLTMPELNKYNPEVAENFQSPEKGETAPYNWFSNIGYEAWAQRLHENVLEASDAGDLESLKEKVDAYFDELERIRDESLSGEGGKLEVMRRKVHETMDYYGVVMANALTRAFPLNHPLLGHCLERMQKADPMPEEALFDCARGIPAEPGSNEVPGPVPRRYRRRPVQVLEMLRREIAAAPPHGVGMKSLIHGVIAKYRQNGFDILPAEDVVIGYRNFKLIQLIYTAHSDIESHAPDHPQSGRKAMVDEATLRMLLSGRRYIENMEQAKAAGKQVSGAARPGAVSGA